MEDFMELGCARGAFSELNIWLDADGVVSRRLLLRLRLTCCSLAAQWCSPLRTSGTHHQSQLLCRVACSATPVRVSLPVVRARRAAWTNGKRGLDTLTTVTATERRHPPLTALSFQRYTVHACISGTHTGSHTATLGLRNTHPQPELFHLHPPHLTPHGVQSRSQACPRV